MPRLLRQHHLEKIKVVVWRLEPLDNPRQKNRRPVAGCNVILRPADVFLDQLL
jgi:hypothetical protein